MSHLRFNHVFLSLLLLSAVCAFVVPLKISSKIRGQLDVLFSPITYPVTKCAQFMTHRLSRTPDPAASPAGSFNPQNTPADAQAEIARLRAAIAALTIQNAEILRQQKAHQLKGDVQQYSFACKVIGADASRDSLSLAGTTADGLAVGMPVVYRDFIVGRLTAAGIGGSQVRLITDRGFRVNGSFGRFKDADFIPIATDPPLLEGRGAGLMTITNLTMKQVDKTVQIGDWVVLQDSEDWPLILNGYQLGRVEKIEEQPKARLFAQVTVRPSTNLLQLRQAMVVTRTATAAAAAPPAAKLPAAPPTKAPGTAAKKPERNGPPR
jgi:cell shape-determining protein MreC